MAAQRQHPLKPTHPAGEWSTNIHTHVAEELLEYRQGRRPLVCSNIVNSSGNRSLSRLVDQSTPDTLDKPCLDTGFLFLVIREECWQRKQFYQCEKLDPDGQGEASSGAEGLTVKVGIIKSWLMWIFRSGENWNQRGESIGISYQPVSGWRSYLDDEQNASPELKKQSGCHDSTSKLLYMEGYFNSEHDT